MCAILGLQTAGSANVCPGVAKSDLMEITNRCHNRNRFSAHHRESIMLKNIGAQLDLRQPAIYQIRIKGHLGPQWKDWFGGLTITLHENGDTLITGQLVDQAALHGLLKKVRDLGIPLVSVNRINSGLADAA
jgi:hypothetical protein